jgi:ABC-type Mn2+/Zn2+ transport system ATPase subunit
MDDLKINLDLEGCYGIEKLFEEIIFNKKNNIFAIYAPNGTMKTSLTKTISDIIDNEDLNISKDKIDNNIDYKRLIKFNDNKISYQSENILVLKSYDFFSNDISFDYIEKKNYKITESAIITFNERFSLPFEILLKDNKIVFIHKKTKREYNKLEKDLLSLGEQKTFYIFDIILKIEKYKNNSEITKEPFLVVLDDIADSFDYQNKYSIIEYIHELKESEYMRMLILTHSFDFFSSLNTRIELWNNKYIAIKNENKQLKFIKIKNNEMKLNYFIEKIQSIGDLILSIPITRTLMEYENKDNYKNTDDHKKLISALHYKRNTLDLTMNDIVDIKYINNKTNSNLTITNFVNFDDNYLFFLFQEAKNITEIPVTEENIGDMLIKNKIILCLAIRIKTEKFAKTILSLRVGDDKKQLGSLFKQLKSTINQEEIKIYRKSTLITPELIHLDLLNYSLMMDLSIANLISHYKNILIYENNNTLYLKKLKEKNNKQESLFKENIELFIKSIQYLNVLKKYKEYILLNNNFYNEKWLKKIVKASERRNINNIENKIDVEFYDVFFENNKYLKKIDDIIKVID